MKPSSFPIFTGIRLRLLHLTLLPLLFISLLLGGYFTLLRLDDTEENMIERGQLLARMVASSSEFGLMTNNIDLLRGATKGPILEKDVADIVYFNIRHEVIHRSSSFPIQPDPSAREAYKAGSYWYFTRHINISGVPFSENPEFQELDHNTETIGYVVVVIDESYKLKKEREILIATILMVFAGFTVAFIMALRFGNKISVPILGISEVMKDLTSGDYSSRVTATYTDEFNTLSTGLNSLAKATEHLISDQQANIDKATNKMQVAFGHLETKNQQLSQAKQQADEANSAKDQFLARMSHELRTPLTSVVGFSGLLKKTHCTQEQLEHIRVIDHTSNMLLSIIDDILDFSKLQQDATQLESLSVCLGDIIYDVLEMQAPKAHDKELELIAHLPNREELNITTDPTRLKQVISNLVSNAVKFTEQGSVEVHVDIHSIRKNEKLFSIRVVDTGIGIAQENIDKLFAAFSQADTSITRRYGGSGLGLIISKKIIELMGGKLTIASKENEGTSISLYIPFNVPTLVTATGNVRKEPILFFESNPSLRRATIKSLEHKLLNIHPVRSYRELERLAQEYEVVVVSIPVKNTTNIDYQIFISELSTKVKRLIVVAPHNTNLAIERRHSIISKPCRPSSLFKVLNLEQENKLQNNLPNLVAGKVLNVLVAEDNNFNKELIRKILTSNGIDVETASNGNEALRIIQLQEPDLIIMDMHMPVMGGLEATERLRAQGITTPIIALTANVIATEHKALRESGVNRVLLKPIDEDLLVTSIYELTKERHSLPSLPCPSEGSTRLYTNKRQVEGLHEELVRLIDFIFEQLRCSEYSQIGETAHQLIGLAGLYDIPEIENTSIELEAHLLTGDYSSRSLWAYYWRLYRLIMSEDN